jgi:PAS domain S-box-containing protein
MVLYQEPCIGSMERQSSIRVLLVEDSPSDARLIQVCLAEAGAVRFIVTHAGRLAVAEELLGNEVFDVVLLDLSLPDAHGLEALHRLCVLAPQLPLLVLTGLDDESLAVTAVQEGAQDYLSKSQLEGPLLSRAVRYAIERKRTEVALRAIEERYRAVATGTQVTICEISTDARLVYVTPNVELVLGYEAAELLGRSLEELVHPEDVAEVLGEMDRAVRMRSSGRVQYRFRHRRDGWRWLESSSTAYVTATGEVRGIAVSRDVTEQRRAEDAKSFLADASGVLAASLDDPAVLEKVAQLAVPRIADWCMVHLVQEDGAAIPAALAHVDAQSASAARELMMDLRADLDTDTGPGHVLRTGRSELHRETDEGRSETVPASSGRGSRLAAAPLRSSLSVPLLMRGRTLGSITLGSLDAGRRLGPSDLALAEELAHRVALTLDNTHFYREVVESDRRKDEFLAMLSHELRNPLAPILNALHMLRDADRPELKAWAIEVVDRQARHLARLVDDLLDVSRITRGRVELHRRPLKLADVVERAVEACRPFIDERDHELVVELPDEPIWLDADPVRLEQVLVNLLNNAAKYTDEPGRIELWAGVRGAEVELRVRDTGVGIPAEVLPRVFDLFVQAARTLDRSQGGLGIGLTLVRRLVELHGGSVRAKGREDRRGTELIVRLPVLARSAAPAKPHAAETPASRGAQGLRILVVDDNIDSAVGMGEVLRLWGHDVSVTYDGPAALRAFQSERPDVVLLDIGLPGMDGFEVAEKIRQHVGGAALLIVALTGYGQEKDQQRARDAGFDAHFTKPVDLAKLRRLLGAHAAR